MQELLDPGPNRAAASGCLWHLAAISAAEALQRPLDLSPGDVVLYKTPRWRTNRTDRTPAAAVHDFYLVKSLVHASEILWSFQHPGETLRLRDVMTRTGFGKGMCFRLLYTLRHCGFIEKVENNRYRLTAEIRRRKKLPDRLRGAGPGQLLRARGS